MVTEVFWKLPKYILLSSSLFSFNLKEWSPKSYNPAWVFPSVPPVILTPGTAVFEKVPRSHCLGAMGKSYLGPIRNVPRLCPAVVLPSEKLVSRSTAEGQATAFPWKSWGEAGTSGSGCAVPLLLRGGGKLERPGWGGWRCVLASWSWECFRGGMFRTTWGRTSENPCPGCSWQPSEMLESVSHSARSLHVCSRPKAFLAGRC